MSNDTISLVIQAMQLSIVAAIVFLCINPKLFKVGLKPGHTSLLNIDTRFKTPLAIGFFFNLCYLFSIIISSQQISALKSYPYGHFWITLYDVLTGYFFFLSS